MQKLKPPRTIPKDITSVPVLECQRCGYRWVPMRAETPVRCANCRSPYWNHPKQQDNR